MIMSDIQDVALTLWKTTSLSLQALTFYSVPLVTPKQRKNLSGQQNGHLTPLLCRPPPEFRSRDSSYHNSVVGINITE